MAGNVWLLLKMLTQTTNSGMDTSPEHYVKGRSVVKKIAGGSWLQPCLTSTSRREDDSPALHCTATHRQLHRSGQQLPPAAEEHAGKSVSSTPHTSSLQPVLRSAPFELQYMLQRLSAATSIIRALFISILLAVHLHGPVTSLQPRALKAKARSGHECV